MKNSFHATVAQALPSEPRRAPRKLGWTASLLAAASCYACSGGGPATDAPLAEQGLSEEAIDVAPETLEDARNSVTLLDARLAQSPNDPELLALGRELRSSMQRLSGWVDRVEIAPDHFVDFYASGGGVGVSEIMPAGSESVLARFDRSARVTDIYGDLAPNRALPDALYGELPSDPALAETPELTELHGGGAPLSAEDLGGQPLGGELGLARQPLTASDGPFFRDNLCPGGAFTGCHPNWANGGFASATFRRSDFVIAPFGGALLSVQIRSNGVLRHTLPVFSGEVAFFAWQGAIVDVPTRSCCFICACPTEELPAKLSMRWDIIEAGGDSFHWGFGYTNFGNNRNP